METQKQNKIILPGYEHDLGNVYQDIYPSTLWEALTILTPEDRLNLIERSYLLTQALSKQTPSQCKKMNHTLAADYIYRAGLFYYHQLLLQAANDYQAAMALGKSHASVLMRRLFQWSILINI